MIYKKPNNPNLWSSSGCGRLDPKAEVLRPMLASKHSTTIDRTDCLAERCCQVSLRITRVSSFIQDNYGTSVCLEVATQGMRLPPTPNGSVTLRLCSMWAVISRIPGLQSQRSFPTSSPSAVFTKSFMRTHTNRCSSSLVRAQQRVCGD